MLHFRVDVYHHLHSAQADAKLEEILSLLRAAHGQETHMSAQLDALKSEVERNRTVEESAVALLNGLSTQIAALKDDPVALQALADSLKSDNDSLAAAIVTNTPQA